MRPRRGAYHFSVQLLLALHWAASKLSSLPVEALCLMFLDLCIRYLPYFVIYDSDTVFYDSLYL